MALDIPLQYHEFKHLNVDERCLKYAELLQRSTHDGIQPSDLDDLYTDLETLQGASNIRLRQLENEVKILTEWCDKRDKRGDVERELDFLSNVSPPAPPPVPNEKTRPATKDEKPPVKKQKLEKEEKAAPSKFRSKGKVVENKPEPDVYVSKPKLAYDTPNKFWSYVEPYCTDITNDDVKTLEESLSSKADASEYLKVPPLGKHYSLIWAKEDLLEEQQGGSKTDKKRTTPLSSSNLDNVDSALLNIDTSSVALDTDENCPYGTFTQRLISALVDENIMAPMEEGDFGDGMKIEEDNGHMQGAAIEQARNAQGKKVPVVSNAKALENAIKEELFALNLIESTSDDEAEFDADDEILNELRRCQSELKAIRSHNKHSVNRLIMRAKREMKKQSLRQKAKILDSEVMDIYRRVNSSKLKKKGLTRKDREAAWKAIRDRDSIWKMIDNSDNSEKIN